jgi:hypothetical protein
MIPMQIQTQKGGPSHNLFGSVLGGGFTPITDPEAVVDFHELFFTPENRNVERANKLDLALHPRRSRGNRQRGGGWQLLQG